MIKHQYNSCFDFCLFDIISNLDIRISDLYRIIRRKFEIRISKFEACSWTGSGIKPLVRGEWVRKFFTTFTPRSEKEESKVEPKDTARTPEPTKEQILRASQIEHFGQVLPIEDVEKVIDLVNTITRLPCGCRYITTGKADERYCFGVSVGPLGTQGTEPDASFEVLTKNDAKKLFHKFDKEGLMHSIWTGVTPYYANNTNDTE